MAEHATRLRTAVKLEEPVVQQLRNFILTRFRSLRELVNLHNLTQEIYMEMRMELDVGSQEVVAEEKEILADELWADLGHSNHSDPDIKPLLERLLQQRGEDESIPWETLRKQIGVAP